ncbi:MAG: diaminopimelate epimerase [Steroidobacteraceae bacterium]
MKLRFTKMHGAGNDFIVFDAADERALPSPVQLRALANRHTGVGFDQALVLMPPRRAGTQVYYRIFNADGGEVEQCGNGARAVAELLRRTARAAAGEIAMDSPAGAVTARIVAPGVIAVDMGEPRFEPQALPFDSAGPVAPGSPFHPLDVDGQALEIGAVSMGNPHAVLLVDQLETAPVATLGALIERHPRFPRRVNVGFLQIVDRTQVNLRVFERGVGETLACGTGACAAVAVGRKAGRLAERVAVRLPGGLLEVAWPGPGQHLWLQGPAVVAFEGEVDIPEVGSAS